MRLTIMSQNVKIRSVSEGRWPGLVTTIRQVQPDVLMLRECDWLGGVDRDHIARGGAKAASARALALLRGPWNRRSAESAWGMRLRVAPSHQVPVAVAWRPDVVTLLGCETTYSRTDFHHGYRAARCDVGLDVPLVAISAHLSPYSTDAAAHEAQILAARIHRFDGVGVLAGDINHMPLGDPEPDWSQVQPDNRSARCVPRLNENDPWWANRRVGQVLRDADLTDVAAHLADQRAEPALRAPTGTHGGIRVDPAHVTKALAPVVDYWRVEGSGDYSDHYGIAFVLDLDLIDRDALRTYT
jgi:endonuclease/exonuclease/phosphatase family metal-dependent hydrolase